MNYYNYLLKKMLLVDFSTFHNMLKEQTQVDIQIKNVCKNNQIDRYDFDPQVDLGIEGILIPQVVVDFRSQVNILPITTWIKHC